MSRLKPLVRERFKAKSSKYQEVAIHYSGGNTYAVIGIKKVGHCEWTEEISEKMPLKMARAAIWEYAQVQDGLPILARG